VHSTELSNALLVTSFSAARPRSAVASTRTGTFPGPTPMAGLPEEYAARTTGTPPVARMTSVRSSVISASMSGMDGSSTTCTTPSGAPADTAARPSAPAASEQQSFASGWGLMTTALRVSNASRILK
jgi:hypothetical protein